ncbi:hypothetical protein RYR30_001362 [Flavobacterium psychrophilum]|uniref:hypothetical protein n=1 Tax=Flavobacterium psychrophilum TaxID=96345 RepID=UPI00106C9A27|nr:hypothetical protein [Flavobacterium psychrophilum]EKT3957192.1 hypothetical protein [Flavobacterium psychrophilum]ELM3651174.1 hypothetical protein [Flavobacterium psychrophilum]ELM3671416.1 hypothetical protein [Flavobacterium psychrophilum]ELM3726462.1 hypothetical protein [Flavobacterium psychrophilum]ELY1979982.1 hypothetical protein [Flavobacterium psychrophilum]
MNTLSKRLDKFKSFYNNPNPFKNKADEFIFMFSGISLIIVIFGIIIYFFIKEYIIKGIYEYVSLAIVTFSIILAYFFFQVLKKIIDKSQTKNSSPKVNEKEELDLESMTDEEKFISFFNEGLFEEFKTKAIENKILDENLKWIFDSNRKYPVYFYHYLIERGVIKQNKQNFSIKAYVLLTNEIFDLKTDVTMYSRAEYKPSFDENGKINIKADFEYKQFMIFDI